MTTQSPAFMPACKTLIMCAVGERKQQHGVKSTQLQYVLYMVLAFDCG